MSHKLSSISTRAPKSLVKDDIKAKTQVLVQKIAEHQKILYAQSKYSMLIILQGIDASGKDGLIANVFSGLNPLGIDVAAFKAPTEDERKHDFLWRIHQQTPARGMIHIFNRSHYEDILVPVVHQQIDKNTLHQRVRDINNFESMLENNGTVILKFYLHISREEQKERLLERQTNPKKFWKHNDGDWETRKKWKDYMDTYEYIFEKCNKPEWQVVPADQNWFKEYTVASKVCAAIEKLKLEYPK
jgi:PPK2 family polyphosphate:nucleotide phosphotransferase